MGRSAAPVGGEIYSEAPSTSTGIIIQKNIVFIALAALSAVVVVILLKNSILGKEES